MTLKVVGSGLARTGTMSLKLALEQLLGTPCFHMVELLKEPSRLGILKSGHKRGQTDWGAFFEGYGAAVDYPTCLYIPHLLALYPDLKVIHTVRDPQSWYESVYQTVYRGVPKGPGDVLRLIKGSILHADMRRTAPVFMHNEKIIWKGQFQSRFEDKDFAIKVFQEHEAAIRALVPPQNLLLFDVRDGWAPLADFLGLPSPVDPFPKANQRDIFNAKMDNLLLNGVFEP